MPYCPIIGTLGYVLSPDRSKVLLVHRNARADDQHLGKYNGLGGKLEADEDVVAGMRREILEEAGIHCEQMELRGTISWPGFGKNGEDWLGFIFLITGYSEAQLNEPELRNAPRVDKPLSCRMLARAVQRALDGAAPQPH